MIKKLKNFTLVMEISSSGTSVLLSRGTSEEEEDWEVAVVEESAALTGTKLNLLLLKKSLAWKHEMDWGWTETSGDFVSWRGGRQWNRWPEEDTVAPPAMALHSNNIILVCLFVWDTAKGERVTETYSFGRWLSTAKFEITWHHSLSFTLFYLSICLISNNIF